MLVLDKFLLIAQKGEEVPRCLVELAFSLRAVSVGLESALLQLVLSLHLLLDQDVFLSQLLEYHLFSEEVVRIHLPWFA